MSMALPTENLLISMSPKMRVTYAQMTFGDEHLQRILAWNGNKFRKVKQMDARKKEIEAKIAGN